MAVWLPVVSRELCVERLEMIFPRTAFDTVFSSPSAGAVVAAMIYAGAVDGDDDEEPGYIRPSAIYMLRERLLSERTGDSERQQYAAAAAGNSAAKRVDYLMTDWGIVADGWYAANTRETLRDDILRRWLDLGPAVARQGVPANSPAPKWLLRRSFAELFNPGLTGASLESAVDEWTQEHMDPGARLRVAAERARQRSDGAVIVELPTGGQRALEYGPASQIIKGVVEQWAPARLEEPFVVAISEPQTKVAHVDSELMAAAGLSIDAAALLPDLLIVDAASKPVEVWIVEVVHSDGPIDEARKRELVNWAQKQGIPEDRLRFLTAFTSRNAAPAKRRLKDLAGDTFAWYLAEPDLELAVRMLEQPTIASVTSIDG